MSKRRVEIEVKHTFSVLGPMLVSFLVLKCAGYIDWSWWVVLIPLWLAMLRGFLDAVTSEYKR